MWRNMMIALLIVTVVAASGCGGGSASSPLPPPPAISVQISPTSATVLQGATQTFTATVRGTTNTAVAWSVQEGAVGGTITAAGSYSAPATAGAFHVIATSQADTNKTATATISVPGPSVALTPVSVTLSPSGTQAFKASVTGLANTAVTWTLQEAGGGAVSGAGSYTAPIATGFYHLVATSVADATLSGIATITVTTSTARFTPTGNMQNPRGLHSATLLTNGEVLMAGGTALADPLCIGGIGLAELYDSVAGSFTPTGRMTAPRYAHTATLLLNGKVLVTGGYGFVRDCEDLGEPAQASAELYNPSTRSFTATGGMRIGRGGHTATLLENGKVLVAGGGDQGGSAGGGGTATNSAELYDPVTGVFISTGSMTTPRFGHTATLLPNGKVLIAGGVDTTSPTSPVTTATAEIYDPAGGTFTPTNKMAAGRSRHTATLLVDGRVLIAGGAGLATAEIYDSTTGTFSPTGVMGQPRTVHTATLLPSGNVLVAGGSDSTAEIYDASTGSFNTTGGMEIGRWGHTAALLQNGKVLVAGGGARSPLATAELYN